MVNPLSFSKTASFSLVCCSISFRTLSSTFCCSNAANLR
uniref:Uncharacterized protein n=1 Tax=Arundo donax TaxID=35708 RepID=A0A0A9BIR6_ARUDO